MVFILMGSGSIGINDDVVFAEASVSLGDTVGDKEKDKKKPKEEVDNNRGSDLLSDFTKEQYGNLKDGGKSHYYLDSYPYTKEELEEKESQSLFEKGWETFFGWTDIKGETVKLFSETLHFLNNLAFKVNMMWTSLMIATFYLAYNYDLVEQIIGSLSSIMQNVSGISNLKIGGSGLFGGFAKLVAFVSVVYALFVLIWKRQFLDSLGTILKTVLAFAIAILMFFNYSAFLKGVNQVTTEASGLILKTSVKGDKETLSASDKMVGNLWTMFVDRPYLYMQYGTDKIENIGKDRINDVLKKKPNSEKRFNAVKKEVVEYSNNLMTHESAVDRTVFTLIYLVINGIVSIPVYLLSLLLIILQFWFMAIAAMAPFALLFGALPGQFGVVKRYFVELLLPMVLKVVVSFGAFVVFTISEIAYNLESSKLGSGKPISAFIGAAVIHLILFALMFILRHRIKGIFSAGSQSLQELRGSLGEITNPLKSGVQNVATLGGAAIGGVAGGAAGASMGANIGNKLGKLSTGEGDVGDVTSAAFQAQRFKQLDKLDSLKGAGKEADFADTSDTKDAQSNQDQDAKNVNENEQNQEQQYDSLDETENNKSNLGQPDTDDSENVYENAGYVGNDMDSEEDFSSLVETYDNAGPMEEQDIPDNQSSNYDTEDFDNMELSSLEDNSKDVPSESIDRSDLNLNDTNFNAHNDEQTDLVASSLDTGSSDGLDQHSDNLDTNNFDSQPIEGTQDANNMDNVIKQEPVHENRFKSVPSEDATRIEDSPIKNTPSEADTIQNNPDDSKLVESTPIEGSSDSSRAIENSPIPGGSTDKGMPIENTPLQGGKADSKPMESKPLQGNSADTQQMKGSRIQGGSMQGSTMDSNPMAKAPIQGASNNGQSLESQPIQGSPSQDQPVNHQPVSSNTISETENHTKVEKQKDGGES